MQNRWSEQEAAKFGIDPVSLRAYSSRLLGQEAALVQHGGGNTSVKVQRKNLFGHAEEILYVKGSGWDLATIEPQGFAPVKMPVLLAMAQLEKLTDSDMVREQRAAMIDPAAPTPSVEAILHAIVPFKYVDHTHSDAVVTLTNSPDGERLVREIFGPRVLILPYVMPGFVLAQQVFRQTRDLDWSQLDAIVLLHHGVFTFHDEAKIAYENMISLVTRAEEYLIQKKHISVRRASHPQTPEAVVMAELRKELSSLFGAPILLKLDSSEEALGFAAWENVAQVSARGTVTPDHVIHIKPKPMLLGGSIQESVAQYAQDYHAYFSRNNCIGLKELDRCPRWIVWPKVGCVSVAANPKALRIVEDIARHTRRCMQWGESLGGWRPVTEAELFEVEYWELEQAKLKAVGNEKTGLKGKIAVVTGGASGIGKAIAEDLFKQGAAVAILDINTQAVTSFKGDGKLGIECDVTDLAAVEKAIRQVALTFGGLDILVANAGTFPAGKTIEEYSEEEWAKNLDLNLTGHWRALRASIPLLKLGFDPTIVFVASKNVLAPGPGAAGYSAAKAGLTQLARVAALELAPFGIRVNTIHPDAVFDTGLWSEEIVANRAKHYGITEEQYKKKNLLKTEITSQNVAQLVSALVGPAFSKVTGAQIPIDGGSDRVI